MIWTQIGEVTNSEPFEAAEEMQRNMDADNLRCIYDYDEQEAYIEREADGEGWVEEAVFSDGTAYGEELDDLVESFDSAERYRVVYSFRREMAIVEFKVE